MRASERVRGADAEAGVPPGAMISQWSFWARRKAGLSVLMQADSGRRGQ